MVGKDINQLPPAALDEIAAEFDLRFDRYFVLPFGGITGIERTFLSMIAPLGTVVAKPKQRIWLSRPVDESCRPRAWQLANCYVADPGGS